MLNLFTKKITAIILSAIVAVAGFGFFVNVAGAAHEPIKHALEYRWSLPSGTLTQPITEIDDSLYENTDPPVLGPDGQPADWAINQDQIETIYKNIENSGPVSTALRQYKNADAAVFSASAACSHRLMGSDCSLGTGASEQQGYLDAYTKATTDREIAIDNLSLAAAAARDAQQSLIDTYDAQNEAHNLAVATKDGVGGISDSGTTASNAIAEQTAVDVENATSSQATTAVSTAQMNASAQQQEAVNAWISNDPLAVKMQQQCSFGFVGAMNLTPCFANIAYQIIYRPAMYALMGSAYIFDKMLNLSIDSTFVNQTFVSSSWTVIRDFSNMLFIFILLYTGIMTIFGAADWRKTVLQVVIIALLINFSLFFTKVVIDAGNVLAVGVKSAISSGYSISEGIAAGFSPQQFITIAANGSPSGGDAIIVFLVAAVVSGFAAWLFLKAALLFMGRLIAFWFLMIFSPFAFISTALPMGNKFHSWFGTLMSQAFVAPVYLFFIYLIMKVISADNGILSTISSSGTTSNVGSGWFSSLIVPVIVATLIIVALQKALAFATAMSGDFGSIGSDALGKVMGIASVVGTGGAGLAGMAGRKFIGGAAARELERGTDASGNALTDARRATLEARTKSTFDVRNIMDKNSMFSKVTSGKVFKADYGMGGVEKVEKDRIQAQLKAAEGAKMNVFEEKGVRGNTGKVAEAVGANLVEAEKKSAEATTKLAEQVNALAQAQKAHDESETATTLKRAEGNYEQARQRADRDRGTERESESRKAMNEAQDSLATARTTHSSAPTAMAVKTTMAAVEKAKKAEKEALEKAETAKSLTKEGKETEAATWVVDQENKRRRDVLAEEALKKGDMVVASKIRAGEKSAKKSAKDLVAELLEETGEKPKEKAGEAKH